MRDDNEFKPHLGKIANRQSQRGRNYLQRVLHAAALSGNGAKASRRFHGARLGRGASVGRMLASRDRYGAYRQRRVVTKTRIAKLGGKGLDAARAHLRYIQRDGVTRDGHSGDLYSAYQDRTDGKEFLKRCGEDRHQFRFIVSAEDASAYDDLKPFIRRLMTQVEEDLGTKLGWVAVDHFNTGHPHTHIVLRGIDEKGEDLVIARDYIAHGLRQRAAEIVSLDLGPRTDLEIEDRLRSEVEQERFTSLDRSLLSVAGEDRTVTPSATRDPFRQTLQTGRLKKLGRLGLAEERHPGTWHIAPELEDTLQRMGERGDIIRTLHQDMREQGRARNVQDYAIYDPSDPEAKSLIGRVIKRGLSDEINDRIYLVVDSTDGRTHYVDIGLADQGRTATEEAIVAIRPKALAVRHADRTIAEIAASHDGRYSIDIHLRHDPTATQNFAETHVRRLEAMRRMSCGIEREKDGTWIVGADHLERAAAFERKLVRVSPVALERLSDRSLDRQVGAEGATWLDRTLTGGTPRDIRDAGFGHDVKEALERRRQWLIAQDLAREDENGRTVFRANLMNLLRRRDLTKAGAQLTRETGLEYNEAQAGERIEGTYRRAIDLVSGRFALIERSRDFTLVPWREVLERNRDRTVSGIAREEGISWTLGRQRKGPEIA